MENEIQSCILSHEEWTHYCGKIIVAVVSEFDRTYFHRSERDKYTSLLRSAWQLQFKSRIERIGFSSSSRSKTIVHTTPSCRTSFENCSILHNPLLVHIRNSRTYEWQWPARPLPEAVVGRNSQPSSCCPRIHPRRNFARLCSLCGSTRGQFRTWRIDYDVI